MAGMKERPILFSGPMVKAILEGRKTQTRRVCAPTKALFSNETRAKQPCPYGVHGDRLWVRETFREGTPSMGTIFYRADEEWNVDAGWHPSIFMPRWASRITLEITDVRVQRVQDISEEDAEAEGIEWPGSKAADFMQLWDSINAKRGFGWDKNPWVWCISFRRIK